MIKGLLALFTSGLFFHPMVLSGIFLAFLASWQFTNEQIYAFMRLSYFYIGAIIWGFVYTFIFAKVYREGGAEIDKGACILKSIGNTAKFVLAFILTLAFVVSWIF